VFSGREKTFAVVVLLFAASAAIASPTIISESPVCFVSATSNCAAGVVTSDFISNMAFSEFGKAFSRLPLPNSRTAAVTETNRCLPAVPPSIAMVLTGFLCISLVRDRKTWLALLAGLFAIGQTGINVLPELASRLTRKIHNARLVETQLIAAYPPSENFFPDGYNNETQYTGLLHHLAGIPQNTGNFSNNCTTLIRHFSGSAGKDASVLNHTIFDAQFVLTRIFNCLVSRAEQFVCFSPAFIYNLIPRGPPVSA